MLHYHTVLPNNCLQGGSIIRQAKSRVDAVGYDYDVGMHLTNPPVSDVVSPSKTMTESRSIKFYLKRLLNLALIYFVDL